MSWLPFGLHLQKRSRRQWCLIHSAHAQRPFASLSSYAIARKASDSRSKAWLRITAANINDVTPVPLILEDLKRRLGKLPVYMGFDVGCYNAPIAHLLEEQEKQGVIGYRRHTHKREYFGKWRFRYDPECAVYICSNKKHPYWKMANRQGHREYYSDVMTRKNRPYQSKCFSEAVTRRQVTRHVWQDALESITDFTMSPTGKRLYAWRKETIERSFAEVNENHGLHCARMCGIQNVFEQSFLPPPFKT